MSQNQWSSRLSFIITTAAFAVGIGNIWRFPYMVGEGGGGAFLIVYLGLCLIVGLPILILEIGMGRMSGKTPFLGYGQITKSKYWNLLGWFGAIASIIIMSFYVVVLSWVLIYGYEAVSGKFATIAPEQFTDHYQEVVGKSSLIILINIMILTSTVLILKQGIQSGLEKYTKWMMIALLLIIVSLALWAVSLEGSREAYQWYLTPDFSKININTTLNAMGQLFFSVGVGMTTAFAFGSFTSKKDNLISSAVWIIIADTVIAVLAGFMIFPMIFHFNMSPDSGPNLIFVTMAKVFGQMQYGSFFGLLFFILLFLAGFTSLLTAIQGLKDSFQDRFRLSINKSLTIPVLSILILSIPCAYSFIDEPLQIFGYTIFGAFEYLTNNIMLPLSGLGIIIVAGYVLNYKKLKANLEVAEHPSRLPFFWQWLIRIVLPLAVVIILWRGLS